MFSDTIFDELTSDIAELEPPVGEKKQLKINSLKCR